MYGDCSGSDIYRRDPATRERTRRDETGPDGQKEGRKRESGDKQNGVEGKKDCWRWILQSLISSIYSFCDVSVEEKNNRWTKNRLLLFLSIRTHRSVKEPTQG
ncbi:hypothetical protein TNCT_430661 [Trichonephila clavata]|uniref:Uncharacterized protein n=1 Tax=Trichonephila clavata TaxID=2740835 RepID=A0A8X6KD20_TRICU|nr:hypothetical protein TNCT_430661 [Trichonephila clavata]